jgi:hypothetical protein
MKRQYISCLLIAIFCISCCTKPIPDRFRYLNFKGNINQHRKLIKAKPEVIFNAITDNSTFKTLYPADRIEVSKVSEGPYAVGTILNTQTKYFVRLSWQSQVIEIVPDQKIVLLFISGVLKDGYEIWELNKAGEYTEVTHTLFYKVNGFFYSLIWTLKNGDGKHDYLVEETLDQLKRNSEDIKLSHVP